MKKVDFQSDSLVSWARGISKLREDCVKNCQPYSITSDGAPLAIGQISSICCLKEFFRRYGAELTIDSSTPINCTKIYEPEIELQGEQIKKTLVGKYKPGKDYSAVALALTEALYNVKDHSRYNGNAFYNIRVNAECNNIEISVCDFGEGIPATIRKQHPSFNDNLALSKAFEDRFSTHTSEHNAGMGLSNIKSVCMTENGYLEIISNSSRLIIQNSATEVERLDFDFKGTLLYLKIDLGALPDEDDIINDFNW